jgi:long-chain fatty acid transport protein
MVVKTALLVFVGLTVTALNAEAGGFYVTDIGARGMGRGGAFVAAPDSLLAIHYNPAGLSKLRGLHVEASLALVQMDLTFTRTCPCVNPANRMDAAELDSALAAKFQPSESHTPLAIPFLAIGYGLPILDLTVALAVWGPNSGRHEWGELPSPDSPAYVAAAERQPQRYSALAVRNIEINYALGAAFSPLDGLRLGGTLMLYQTGASQTTNLWVNSMSFASSPEDARFDIPLEFRYRQAPTIGWAVGASYEMLPGLTIGSSFRGKRNVSSDGTVGVSLPEFLKDAGASVTGDKIKIELATAPILRAGVEFAIPSLFRAEAAVVGEFWSVHERIVVTPQDVTFTLGAQSQELEPIIQERNWRDSWSFRLGGEVNLLEPLLGLRAGYFFEPSAIAPDKVDPSRVDLDKHGFALGASTQLFGVTLEVSAMYVALAGIEIDNTTVLIKAPLQPPLGSPELITWTGNGSYNGSYFIGAASLSFSLDLFTGQTGNKPE